MADDSRTGAFWERHNQHMQDPERAAQFDAELARIRAVDAEVNDDNTLRAALTKLAERWDRRVPLDPEEELRALLAAHPAPECECVTSGPDLDGPSETCPQHGRSYSEWVERGDILQARLDALAAPVCGAYRLTAKCVRERCFGTAPEVVHFSAYGSSTSSCGLTKPHDEQGFTDRRALTTCPVCLAVFGPAPVSDPRREDEKPADLRLTEDGWLYEQKNECDCASYYGAHEYTCAKEPVVQLSALPGWEGMLAECARTAPPVVSDDTQREDVDEDGLTPLEQTIAKRLYERWEDDFGNLSIQADPRDVALWLRAVLPSAPVVDEAAILDCMTTAWAAHIGVGDPVTPLPVHRQMAAAVAARLRGATRG